MRITVLVGTIFAAAAMLVQSPPATAQDDSKTYEYLDLFGTIFERIRSNYVEEVDEVELVEAAIRGMITSLDPHSAYLDPEGFDDMQVQTRGSFGGLGIEITQEDGFVKVVSPIDDTPADRAGLMAGDFITHVDGESILGLTLQESVDLLRGEIGSPVTLTVAREGEVPFDVEIIRDEIKIRAVRHRAEGDIGYIRVTTFSGNVDVDLTEAIADLDAEIGADLVRGYVLDLRNNPGGLLTQAVEVSDLFLERGEIVSTRGRDPGQTQRYNASPGDLADGLPIVVLVNGGSASASEIVSGALQDHRRGIVVGTKTFGKGSVQNVQPLNDKGALRLTVARYYTPSGRSIQGFGVTPDIEVEFVPPAEEEADAELPAAGVNDESDLEGSLDSQLSAEEQAEREAEDERRSQMADLRRRDNQLAYALDLIRGIDLYR